MTVAKANRWILTALLCVPVAVYSASLRKFPGPQSELKSPDGRYSVENIDSDKEPYHSLVLKNAKTGEVRPLYTYPRHVTVLWSPDGNNLVVNDYAGSDFSKALVFTVDQSGPPVDIRAQLLQFLKDSPDRRSLTDNDHVYVAVSTWQGHDAMHVKVWGYGGANPKGFTLKYVYTLGGSFRLNK